MPSSRPFAIKQLAVSYREQRGEHREAALNSSSPSLARMPFPEPPGLPGATIGIVVSLEVIRKLPALESPASEGIFQCYQQLSRKLLITIAQASVDIRII